MNLAFVRFFDFRNMHGAFVWLAHDGFVAAGKTKFRKIYRQQNWFAGSVMVVWNDNSNTVTGYVDAALFAKTPVFYRSKLILEPFKFGLGRT